MFRLEWLLGQRVVQQLLGGGPCRVGRGARFHHRRELTVVAGVKIFARHLRGDGLDVDSGLGL